MAEEKAIGQANLTAKRAAKKATQKADDEAAVLANIAATPQETIDGQLLGAG